METLTKTPENFNYGPYVVPSVDSLPCDRKVEYRPEITVPFVIEAFIDDQEELEDISGATLMYLIDEAINGSEVAYEQIWRNVATDFAERMYKAGHVTEVPLQVKGGRIEQNGTKLSTIHKNTLEHMPLNHVMRNRTEMEAANADIFEDLWEAGVFEEYDVAVFSLVPTDAKTRKEYNFFTDTDSLSMQYLKKVDENELVMETAMVAGKTSPEAERHDISAVREILEEEGFDTSGLDENGFLSCVMLIPKSDKSGVHLLVERLDEKTGRTFFGQNKPRQNYEAYRAVCREREATFKPTIDKITADLISSRDSFKKPYDAIEKLDELSDRSCVEFVIDNTEVDIDLSVFGKTAALHIEQARIAKLTGDRYALEMHMKFAKETSTSSSCPTKTKERQLGEDWFDEHLPNDDKEYDEDGECDFISKECPECGKKNVKTHVSKIDNGNKKLIKGSCGCTKVVKA